MLKQDLETLKAFYNTNLLTSKMADMYKNANTMVQVRNFNYIPKTTSLVLYNANVLTIEKMREILGIFQESQATQNVPETSTPKTSTPETHEEKDFISDDDLLSNPFFTTLTPLN